MPDKPGVYIFKDAKNNILYVGKAAFLKKRVLSYFRDKSSLMPKQRVMISKVKDVEFLVVEKEIDALLLESNLIKEYHPYYNVLLRDDKSYPYLAITLADDFPRALVTRNLHIEGAKYYGPYTKAHALRSTLNTLRKIFLIRACKRIKPGKLNGSPCLNFYINKCLAPCLKKISQEEYRKMVNDICQFMEGKSEKVIKGLEKEMIQASKNLEFEKAALCRDKIKAAEHILEKQAIISTDRKNRDIAGIFEAKGEIYIKVLFIRQGKLIGSRGYILKQNNLKEALLVFLDEYYSGADYIPSEILLPFKIGEEEFIEGFLRKRAGHKVKVIVPIRGQKKSLIKMAAENAVQAYFYYRFKGKPGFKISSEVLSDLKEKLKMPKVPYRIECFDVSTLFGKDSVGSMVVFEDGKPLRKAYRHFRVKRVARIDDFAMMKEVISRRLTHIDDTKFGRKPDLILVDGGKPQISAALKALEKIKEREISVAALAKREEEIFLPKELSPLSLPPGSMALKLLQAIRDEAHRFALSYHQKLRRKSLLGKPERRKTQKRINLKEEEIIRGW